MTSNNNSNDNGRAPVSPLSNPFSIPPFSESIVFEGVLDLQEAVAVAIEGTQKAGIILKTSYVKRNQYKASLFAPTELPGEGPTEVQGNEVPPTTTTQPESVESPGDPQEVSPTDNNTFLIGFKPKKFSTDLETNEKVLCYRVIESYLKTYSDSLSLRSGEEDTVHFSFVSDYTNMTEFHPKKETAKHHFIWCVDALNGSVNFVHGLPDVAISVALVYDGPTKMETILSLVFCPFLVSGAPPPSTAFMTNTRSISEENYIHGEIFVAVKGKGMFLNGRRVKSNAEAATVQKCLMFWDLPSYVSFDSDAATLKEESKQKEAYTARYNECVDRWADLRRICCSPPYTVSTVRMGNSLLTTVSQLACGRVDLCVEPCCHLVHVATAALLMEESGGVLSDLYGNSIDLSDYVYPTHDHPLKPATVIAGANREVVQFAADLCKKEEFGRFWGI